MGGVFLCFTPMRFGITGTVSPGTCTLKERCDKIVLRGGRNHSGGMMASSVGTP